MAWCAAELSPRMRKALLFVGAAATLSAAKPKLAVWKALKLAEGSQNDHFATLFQAMNVWQTSDPQKEVLVAQVNAMRDIDKRADDHEYAVMWESDGIAAHEIARVNLSCPNVFLCVPPQGPYIYEARMALSSGSLHQECSCTEKVSGGPNMMCPRGVRMYSPAGIPHGDHSVSTAELNSPLNTHSVTLMNEYSELIADRATLPTNTRHIQAQVQIVEKAILNLPEGLPGYFANQYGCPGTRDDFNGNDEVSIQELMALGRVYPEGYVKKKWCVVWRGKCSETAKVKVCMASGAIGVIILDHGNFGDDDQEIVVHYHRGRGEVASIPVLFLSEYDGAVLAKAVMKDGSADVIIGPTVGGTPPVGYNPGSGILVHVIGPNAAGPAHGSTKYWPDLFGTAAWLEHSPVRNVLLVCLEDERRVVFYDTTNPMSHLPRVGEIGLACNRLGRHDYRILDFKMGSGFHTLLIDPVDKFNRLIYYNTTDLSNPKLWVELFANWEAEYNGLGQVRPGGPDGRYHIVTWHCSDLYCGKKHGDAVYILDTHNLLAPPLKIEMPMMSKGSLVRDVGCELDGLCIASLAWDGLVALDSGVAGTQNLHRIVAEHTAVAPWSTSVIPLSHESYKMFSGAQKVYPSKVFPNRFYVEQAKFSMRPLRLGDVRRALDMNELWIAHIQNYNPQVSSPFAEPTVAASAITFTLATRSADTVIIERDDGNESVMIAIWLVIAFLLLVVTALVAWIACRKVRAREMQMPTPVLDMEGRNVVVGRPIDGQAAESGGDENAITTHPFTGEPVRVFAPVASPKGEGKQAT